MIDGTVTIIPIIVPFNTISLILSLDFVGSDNRLIFKNGNKNQRDFIKNCSQQTLIGKGFSRIILILKKRMSYFVTSSIW